jgi:hypothetical protein
MIGFPSSRAALRWQVITWGPNTLEWNQTLHVTGMRLGCSDSPASCMRAALAASRDGAEVFLAVPLRVDTAAFGAEYARLSRANPSVAEIGIDDFAGQYRNLLVSGAGNAAAILNSLIDGVKSDGSKLKFGATIYEDELASPEFADSKLPSAIRARFDVVHLYLHYRASGTSVPEFVRQAKVLFPNAGIILGVYAYDRISYISCAKGDTRRCSKREELDFFGQALDVDFTLLESGAASGLEFYPGAFGREDGWSGWDKPQICPGRKQECIANTKELREIVANRFRKGNAAARGPR